MVILYQQWKMDKFCFGLLNCNVVKDSCSRHYSTL